MKNKLLLAALIGCGLVGTSLPAASQNSLDTLYEKLRATPGTVADSVRYTGSDFDKAGGGFNWQRGAGRGWTTGCRLTCTDVAPDEAENVRKVFMAWKDRQFVNSHANDAGTVVEEPVTTVYHYVYNPEERKLYFLRASTEGELCVPVIWPTADYVDARPHDPLARFPLHERYRLGAARLWAEVRRNFVFMDRVRTDWDSLYVATAAQTDSVRSLGEYTRLLQRMAAALGDGHTYVHPVDCRTAPLTTVLIGGRVYVESVESSAAEKLGIGRGMELVSINGEAATAYGRRVQGPLVSSSTPQWTEHEIFDGHGLLKTYGQNDTLRLVFADRKGRELPVTYVAGSWKRDKQEPTPTFEYKKLKDGVGYLRIRDFMSGSFRDDFDKIYPRILKAKGLVIDLRGNGGGNSGNADYVLRHLTADTIRTASWSSPTYIPAFASWGRRTDDYRSPSGRMLPHDDRPLYTGRVAVLTDRGTFSAAEDFCAVFSGMKRGPLVGTPTGGSTGNGVRVELLKGYVWANICAKHDVAPDGTEFVGRGLQPAIRVEETYASWFEDKTDAALARALRYIATGQ